MIIIRKNITDEIYCIINIYFIGSHLQGDISCIRFASTKNNKDEAMSAIRKYQITAIISIVLFLGTLGTSIYKLGQKSQRDREQDVLIEKLTESINKSNEADEEFLEMFNRFLVIYSANIGEPIIIQPNGD